MKPLSLHGLLTRFLFCLALFSPYWASAQDSLTITSNNSSLTYYRTANHLPLVLQWKVDGQDYWIFPASRDLTFKFRNDHFHTGLHVTDYQIHAQGFLATPGIPVDTSQGQVYAGVVYSVIGSAARSGQSVISEKIHIFNNTKSGVTVELVGMGYKASEDEYAGPALTDLAALRNIAGSSVAFVDNGYIAVTPYGPLTQFQFNNFKGFNPESSVQRATIGPGQHATMITELKIGY